MTTKSDVRFSILSHWVRLARIIRTIVLLFLVAFFQSGAVAQKTAQAVLTGKSLQLLPSEPVFVAGAGNVTAYYSTFNGTSGSFLIGTGGIVSGELRPRATAPGLYEGAYLEATPLASVDYGSYVVSFPQTDADGDGVPDLLQSSRDANITSSGSGYSSYYGLTFSVSLRLSRSAGSAMGTYSVTTQNSAGQIFTVGGQYALLAYTGTLTYVRGATNTLTISLTSPISSGPTLTGTSTFTVTSTDQLTYAAFIARDAVSGLSYQVKTGSLTRSGMTYRGNLSVVDGEPRTGWADFLDYYLSVTDGNDSNADGIPDLTAALPVAPAISVQPQSQTVMASGNAVFSVTATGTAPLSYQWLRDGVNVTGANSATLTLNTVQTNQAGNYTVVISNASGSVTSNLAVLTVTSPGTVVAWGNNGYGQTTVPAGVSAVSAIAAGVYHTLALKGDGTVVAWGNNGSGQTTVPAGLSGVTAIAAGVSHSVALKSNGTVVAWGNNTYGQTSVPASWSGVTDIAAGDSLTVALKSDGTVVACGFNFSGQATVPVGLSGVTAIATGGGHTVALKSDGTVVAWGAGKTNIGGNSLEYGQSIVPVGLSGVIAIAAGGFHTVVLKSNGTVVAWGYNSYGQTNVPAGLSGVTAIAAGGNHTVALKKDGTVVAWGNNSDGQASVPVGLSGVTAIEGGDAHTVAIIGGSDASHAARLVNLSVRSAAGSGSQTLIVGFVITGSGTKTLLLRGVGPTLVSYGIVNAVADPSLRLFNGGGTEVIANDDWGGSAAMAANFSAVGAVALPASSKDAALYTNIPSGPFTFHVVANSSSPGVALAELYDADAIEGTAKVVNISARTQVGTGENVLIAGFVITGNTPKTLLIRGLGPTLASYGVTGVLTDPQLSLYNGGTLVTSNDDWSGTAALKTAFATVGAVPLVSDASKDAALLVTLQPGLYSAQVSGVGSTTGVGLVEIFLMP
jgi:alpha-tubulin suppressor-like RCC1 family protein